MMHGSLCRLPIPDGMVLVAIAGVTSLLEGVGCSHVSADDRAFRDAGSQFNHQAK
eukprot:m.205482 g.205482  ORF g.205482 m.205482 type:complete len:55 (+) comp25326_c0_seq5:2628-2792(+)